MYCVASCRFGIRITRGQVKLFADLLTSDIIIASPLAVATKLAEDAAAARAAGGGGGGGGRGGRGGRKGAGGRGGGHAGRKGEVGAAGGAGAAAEAGNEADFLSSIEICVLERADVMMMQNWQHVVTGEEGGGGEKGRERRGGGKGRGGRRGEEEGEGEREGGGEGERKKGRGKGKGRGEGGGGWGRGGEGERGQHALVYNTVCICKTGGSMVPKLGAPEPPKGSWRVSGQKEGKQVGKSKRTKYVWRERGWGVGGVGVGGRDQATVFRKQQAER